MHSRHFDTTHDKAAQQDPPAAKRACRGGRDAVSVSNISRSQRAWLSSRVWDTRQAATITRASCGCSQH